MNEKINLTIADGTAISADIICFLENTKTGKRYLYYTLNETTGDAASGTVKIYVSKVSQGNPALDTPITEEEWGTLKGYMSDALKGNNNPDVKYIALSELGTPISISEKAIAMPTSYDYINKQRGIYAQNVATSEPAPAPEIETPATPELSETSPAVEPTPVPTETPVVEVTPAPVAPEPTVETPPAPPVQEPVPTADPLTTPEEAPTPESVPTPPPVEAPIEAPIETSSETDGGALTLTPINIEEIEQKYSEMIETINKLKNQEIEAAKRYNATIELSAMHKEQHANYVQNEQNKEQPAPVSAPASEPTETPAPPVQEPTPAPSTPVTDANLETNWFDMPES